MTSAKFKGVRQNNAPTHDHEWTRMAHDLLQGRGNDENLHADACKSLIKRRKERKGPAKQKKGARGAASQPVTDWKTRGLSRDQERSESNSQENWVVIEGSGED